MGTPNEAIVSNEELLKHYLQPRGVSFPPPIGAGKACNRLRFDTTGGELPCLNMAGEQTALRLRARASMDAMGTLWRESSG